jgi:hypothetical protein
MKNLLIVLALVTVFAFAANAQSKDCCSKEKGETTKVEKCTDKDHTMKTGDVQKTTTTTSAGLKDGKEVVVTKVEKKENCGDKSSCCDVKKEKTTEKVEKEVEKKETH